MKNKITKALWFYFEKNGQLDIEDFIENQINLAKVNNSIDTNTKGKLKGLKKKVNKITEEITLNSDDSNDHNKKKYQYIINNLSFGEVMLFLRVDLFPDEIFNYVSYHIKKPKNMPSMNFYYQMMYLRNSLSHNTHFMIYLQEGTYVSKHGLSVNSNIKIDRKYNPLRVSCLLWILNDTLKQRDFIQNISPFRRKNKVILDKLN